MFNYFGPAWQIRFAPTKISFLIISLKLDFQSCSHPLYSWEIQLFLKLVQFKFKVLNLSYVMLFCHPGKFPDNYFMYWSVSKLPHLNSKSVRCLNKWQLSDLETLGP